MKNNRRRRSQADLFEISLATGIGQALAGWAAEYTHSVLERDPELRRRLRENWQLFFERFAWNLRQPEPSRRAGTRRRMKS